MFTKQVIQHAIWSRQKDHGFPIASRSVPVNFSLGPRSLFVSLSKTDREPNEEQAKNERKSNECRSRNYRKLDEKPSSWLAYGWLMTDKVPSSNHKPEKCLLFQACRGRILHFLSHTEHFLGE